MKSTEPSAELDRTSRAALWLLSRSAPERDREEMLGDLLEELQERLANGSSRGVALSLWSEALRSLIPNLLRRERTNRSNEESILFRVIQDLKFAVREHGRRPLVGALVILTLALGIAANTVIYSAVDALVLDPFPYPDSNTLVGVGTVYPRLERELAYFEVLSPPEIENIRNQTKTLERIVVWDMGHRTIAGEDAPENVFSAFWWGNVFETLETPPILGRGFSREETEGDRAVAVISHSLWQRRFGGSSEAIGEVLMVNGNPHEIIGVMDQGTSIYGTELWLPMGVSPAEFPRERRQFQFLARIRDGYRMADVALELETIARRMEAEFALTHDEYGDFSLVPATWNEVNMGQLKPLALALVGAVLFILLLVCVNIANLLLGRSLRREQEMAVRRTMGAGTGRLVQQMLTESSLLAILGGMTGVGFAWYGVEGIAILLGSLGLPLPTDNIALNSRVLIATAGLTLLAGLLFGLAPALQTARRSQARDLRASRAGVSPPAARQNLQRLFVGAQVALALVLVHGSFLFVSSFLAMQSVDPGLRTTDTTTLRITLPWSRYDADTIPDFFFSLQERAESLPEVEQAAIVSQLPPAVFSRSRFTIEGQEPPSEEATPWAYLTGVSPGMFETLEIPLREGRGFTSQDGADTARVVVVNSLFAERYLDAENPLGQRLQLDRPSEEDEPIWFEVVGVVDAVRNRGLSVPPSPEVYAALSQNLFGNQLFLALHSSLDASQLAQRIKGEVRALDPEIAIYAVQNLDDAFHLQTAPASYSATLLALLGGLALLLAGVGVYSVVSVATASRTREIGLRLALGATARRVRHWLVGVCAWPVAIGAVVGLFGALALGQVLGEMLPGMQGSAAYRALALSALSLLTIAVLAALVPTIRASRLDPLESLRSD